jgi:hypothetical protein
MRLIDCSHIGVNIAERILQVISEYNMNSKVFSITLDNASANAYAMSELTPSLFYMFLVLLYLLLCCIKDVLVISLISLLSLD